MATDSKSAVSPIAPRRDIFALSRTSLRADFDTVARQLRPCPQFIPATGLKPVLYSANRWTEYGIIHPEFIEINDKSKKKTINQKHDDKAGKIAIKRHSLKTRQKPHPQNAR